MNSLSVLKSEHSALLSNMHRLDEQLTLLESLGPVSGASILKELVQTSSTVRQDLVRHTTKEEKSLFPTLEAKLGSDRELLEVMRREHEKLVGSMKSLTAGLDQIYDNKDTTKTLNLVSRLHDLQGRLADHFSHEERVLFWLAELRLSPLDKKKIAYRLQTSNEGS